MLVVFCRVSDLTFADTSVLKVTSSDSSFVSSLDESRLEDAVKENNEPVEGIKVCNWAASISPSLTRLLSSCKVSVSRFRRS